MKIGLQFAMPAEFHALPGAKELEAFETVSGVPFYEAAPGIIACAGGVSKVNAAMAAEILCLKYGVDMIVNAGVAGCLTELPTGSLVVAEDFVQHDVDTSAIGDPVGLVSTVNRVSFPTWKPERCVELLAALGRKAALGRVATGDWFAVRSDRAIFIRDTFHPLLTEMEGGAIAQGGKLLVDLAHRLLGGVGFVGLALAHERADLFRQLVALGLQGLFLGDDLAALHIKGGELLRREGGVAVLHRFGDLVEVLAYVLDVQHGAALFHNDRLPGTPTIRRFSMRPSIAPPAGAGGKSSGAAGAGGQKSG